MSRQLATLGGAGPGPAAPATITAGTIAVGDKFADAKSLRTQVERVFLAQGRQCRLDRSVSGGPGKLIRCSGAVITPGAKGVTGCQALVRAYKQRGINEWNITEVNLEPAQCTGRSGEKKKRACRRSVEEEAAALINANHSISCPALVKSLKATAGVDILERTGNRMPADVFDRNKKIIADEYKLLDSYLELIGRNDDNYVDCQVSTSPRSLSNTVE